MIATDGISDEQKATVKFQSAYADMMSKLTSPDFIPALCAHEAAHLIYDSVGQRFFGHYAAIQLAEEPLCEPHKWQEYVQMMARVHVAGGVVGRKLFPASSGGDEVDKQNFKKLCADLTHHFGGISIDVEQCWRWAQESVKKQLEDDPHIMEMIQRRAAELRYSFGF